MTRKLSRNYSLSVVAAFVAILSLLIAAAALAQMTGTGQPKGKTYAAPVALDVSEDSQTLEHRSPLTSKNGRPIMSERWDSSLFLPPDVYGSGGTPRSIAVADVNGDGKSDLVVANGGSTVGVLLGNGDGTFQPVVTLDSGGDGLISVTVADVNNDGKPDVVVAHNLTKGTVGVLLGNGDGSFQPAVTYDSGGDGPFWHFGVNSLAVADVNGDSKPDLLVANDRCAFGHPCVGVLLGKGDGTFQPAVTSGCHGKMANGGNALAVADLNHDDRPDVVLEGAWELCLLLGNGDGTFQAAQVDEADEYFVSLTYADVNGDGLPDLLLADRQHDNTLWGGVGIMLGNGDGTFGGMSLYVGLNTVAVAVGDVNGDGNADLAASGFDYSKRKGATSILFGPSLAPVATYYWGKGTTATTVALVDLNGDAKPDLVVGNDSGAVYVLLNNTGYHSPTATTIASSANPAAVGQEVTYTATVTNQSGGVLTGTVTFKEGSMITKVKLQDNHAAYSRTYDSAGTHTIAASYSGDADNTGSTGTITEYVGPLSSKTVVTTSGSPSFIGQAVTFTATVTPAHGTIPDGELVAFYDGKTALGSVALADGTAAYTTSALSARAHAIKATYAGDTIFKPSNGMLTQVVVKYQTTTALTSSPNPSAHGQAVTFTATVTSAGPMPAGKVKFMDGTTAIGSATLSGSVAQLTKSTLAVGTHPITAQYLGDAASDKSTSSVLNQVVQ
jgi:hypothetical protein